MFKKLLKNKVVKRVIIAVLSLCLLGGVAVAGINAYMISYVDEYILTMEEVGEYIGVTRERIRQIEAKALRKLRHPSRLKKLDGFLGT